MSVLHERIEGLLAAEVEGRGGVWDEPPALYLLGLRRRGVPRLIELPVPHLVWAQDRPPQVLEMMARRAQCWNGMFRAAAAGGLHGVAFRCESWLVIADPGMDAAERERLDADTRAHRLHARPDRVEVRGMWAVDRAGITYTAMLERGEQAARTEIFYPGPGAGAPVGTVPAALDLMVSSLLGVRLPCRNG